MSKRLGVALLGAMLLLGACATPVSRPAQHSGFLSDYEGLELIDDKLLWYQSERLQDYTQFIVDRPEIVYAPEQGDDEFSAAELAALQDYFVSALSNQLSRGDNGYEIVTTPAAGVARFRTAITDLDATVGLLNISLITKVTGAGLGGAAAEQELVDSVSGERLAAAVNWGSGSRVLWAGLTRLGDAKIQINRWCRDIRKRLDMAHDRPGLSR